MSNRYKEIREKHSELYFEGKLTTSRLSKEFKRLGCDTLTAVAIRKIETDKRRVELFELKTYCNFFHTTSDYLLGFSEVESLDITNRSISNVIGLSDDAIETLSWFKKTTDLQDRLKLLDFIISNKRFFALCMEGLMLYIDNKYDTPLRPIYDENGCGDYEPIIHKDSILVGDDVPKIEIGKKNGAFFNGKPLYDQISIPIQPLMTSYSLNMLHELLSELKDTYHKNQKEKNETTE